MSVYSSVSVFLALIMAIIVAAQFKKAFEDARDNNAKLAGTAPATLVEDESEETAESKDEEEGEADGNAPEGTETNPPAEETGGTKEG
jgi:hypothetical protein